MSFQEVKGLTRLYACALAQMKTCLQAEFKSSTAMVIELRFLLIQEMSAPSRIILLIS